MGASVFFLFFCRKTKKRKQNEMMAWYRKKFARKKNILFANLLGSWAIISPESVALRKNDVFCSVGSTCFLWFFAGGHETSQILKIFVGHIFLLKKWILGRPFIQWLKSAGGGTS